MTTPKRQLVIRCGYCDDFFKPVIQDGLAFCPKCETCHDLFVGAQRQITTKQPEVNP